MGTPELPTVVLDGEADNLDASELQPLHNGRPVKNKKMRKLSLARRKFRLEEKLAERSETNKNGPLNRVITANGQMYQLVNQHNGAAMFIWNCVQESIVMAAMYFRCVTKHEFVQLLNWSKMLCCEGDCIFTLANNFLTHHCIFKISSLVWGQWQTYLVFVDEEFYSSKRMYSSRLEEGDSRWSRRKLRKQKAERLFYAPGSVLLGQQNTWHRYGRFHLWQIRTTILNTE